MPRGTRDPSRREHPFGYRAVTSCGGPFQTSSPRMLFCHSVWDVPQPRKASLPVWAPPRSLAATDGITVVFFSSGYLDVSVPLVCPPAAMDSPPDSRPLRRLGSPIRTSPDRGLLTAPRGSFGVRPVLHRLLAPRHPPCALSSLSLRCFQKLARSYPAFFFPIRFSRCKIVLPARMVEPSGIEPLTSCLQGRRSPT